MRLSQVYISFSGLVVASLCAAKSFSFILSIYPRRERLHSHLDAKVRVARDTDMEFNLYFNLVHAPLAKPAVVVLHGGPGLPSDYLQPLKDVLKDRPILFHDQLGCGKSDQPPDVSLYSISNSVHDVIALLNEVKFEYFHLYGQSYGGILAFEYLKQARPSNCLSITLSSAPSSIPLVNKEWDRLLTEIKKQVPPQLADEVFRRQHVCRTFATPRPLQQAYEKASGTWGGIDVIPNYDAEIASRLSRTPALVTRGEFDFVTSENVERWKDCFVDVETAELKGCSHHGLLEKPEQYGALLNGFLGRCDI
jgi:proline iminopeptidase